MDWDQNPQTSTPNQRDLRSHADQLLSLVVQSCVRPLHTSRLWLCGGWEPKDAFPEGALPNLGAVIGPSQRSLVWFCSGKRVGRSKASIGCHTPATTHLVWSWPRRSPGPSSIISGPNCTVLSCEHGPPAERWAFMPPSSSPFLSFAAPAQKWRPGSRLSAFLSFLLAPKKWSDSGSAHVELSWHLYTCSMPFSCFDVSWWSLNGFVCRTEQKPSGWIFSRLDQG